MRLQVKTYIRFIADRRLTQLGLDPLYHVDSNPLPWLDDMLNAVEHANFFENRSTEYSRASTSGHLGGGVHLLDRQRLARGDRGPGLRGVGRGPAAGTGGLSIR